MNCKYSSQSNVDVLNRHYLLCSLLNNDKCPMIRYCPDVKDYISVDNYKLCKSYTEAESNIGRSQLTPNKVVFEKGGKLFIEVNDEIGQVVALENIYDNVPKFVKLYKGNDGEYHLK